MFPSTVEDVPFVSPAEFPAPDALRSLAVTDPVECLRVLAPFDGDRFAARVRPVAVCELLRRVMAGEQLSSAQAAVLSEPLRR